MVVMEHYKGPFFFFSLQCVNKFVIIFLLQCDTPAARMHPVSILFFKHVHFIVYFDIGGKLFKFFYSWLFDVFR